MNLIHNIVLFSGFLLAFNVVNATTIYKCKSPNGSLSYSQSPCSNGDTLVKSKDLSKRLGKNAEKAKKRLEKILKRKNNKLKKRQERKEKRLAKRAERNNNDASLGSNNSNNLSNQLADASSGSSGVNASNISIDNSNQEEPSEENLSEPKRSDVSLPLQEVTEEAPEVPVTTADNQDTEAPSSGGGSPNASSTETTVNVGELYGPIEFKIISWPLTKAYPGLEYNIRMGVIGGQYPYRYELEQSPSGMTINNYTGEIAWTPDASLEDTSANVSVIVTDSTDGKIKQNFNINVTKAGFYFVSPNGNDSSGNGSIGKPWKTMDTAISRAGSDGIVYLRGGLYKGAFTLKSSDSNKWIAYPGEKPVLDLDLSTLRPASDFGYIDGLEIINAQRWAFCFTGEDNWIFRRNHMHHLYDDSDRENPSFIFFWNEGGSQNRAHQNIVIQDNLFHDLYDEDHHHGGSVIMYDVYQSLYEDNEAYSIHGAGAKDKDHGQFNTFRGNYLYNNSTEAFAIQNQGYSNNIEILYNVFHGTVMFGQVEAELSYVLFRHNTLKGQIMHKNANPVGTDKTIVIIDNIISMKKADVSLIEDRADEYTYEAIPYLCCDEADEKGFTSSVLYRNRNLIDFETTYIAGYGYGKNRTLAEWQALGFDIDSIFADPQFNDEGSRDFRPKSSSPACGKAHDGGDIGALPCL